MTPPHPNEHQPPQGVAKPSTTDGVQALVKARRRGRKRAFFFTLGLGISDLILWILLYLGISKVTGSYNAISAEALLIPIAVLMFCMALVRGYHYRTDFASLRYASEQLISCLFGYFVAGFLLFVVASFGPSPTSSRGIFTATVFLFALLSLLARRIYWFGVTGADGAGKFLVIIDGVIGPVFCRDYLASGQPEQMRHIAANRDLLGTPVPDGTGRTLLVEAGHLLPHFDRESANDYEAVVVAADLARLDPSVLRRLSEIHFRELPVYSTESFYENYWKRLPLELVGPEWPLEADFSLVQHSIYTSIKRVVDFLVALIALIIASPVMILCALIIRLTEGGSPFYSQPRVGLHGIPFTLYKLRSMRPGSDKGNAYTTEGDSRVTPLGSFLRKTRLDELPQLWNVLRGDMSMIGPRAEWVRLVEGYEQEIPNYNYRHLVRPGITGWAQVNYPYGASLEDTLQKLSYDLYYIRNFSLRLDAEVILKTLHVMLFGKGR